MTILVTGATGKLSKCLIKRLYAAKLPFLLATRSGTAPQSSYPTVKLDWYDEKTYQAPFDADPSIDKVWLIQPAISDPVAYIKPFVEVAIANGVKRFVYTSSSTLEKGDVVNGKVHEFLVDRGVDYCVLRPTTFTENFGTIFSRSLREGDNVFSAGEDGKVAFVSIEDVAQAGFDALVAEKSPNNDPIIVGPQLYSYDEAAMALSEVLGRKISHKRISLEEYLKILRNFGMEEKYVDMLGSIQTKVKNGSEEAITKRPDVYVGKHDLVNYLKANKELWVKA